MRVLVLLVLLMSTSVMGEEELREWILTDGTTIDATYKAFVGGRVILENENGEQVKKPWDLFTAEDHVYIELLNPPQLRINFKKKSELLTYSTRFILSNMPVVKMYTFGVGVEQRSAGAYNHELTIEFFAIAAQRRHNNKFILVDRQSTSFTLNKENDRKFEYWSPRIAKLDEYGYGGIETRGKKYDTYLILVTDSRGEIIAAETPNKWLLDNVETLMDRGIGNYFDNTCQRVYAGRPKAILY